MNREQIVGNAVAEESTGAGNEDAGRRGGDGQL